MNYKKWLEEDKGLRPGDDIVLIFNDLPMAPQLTAVGEARNTLQMLRGEYVGCIEGGVIVCINDVDFVFETAHITFGVPRKDERALS